MNQDNSDYFTEMVKLIAGLGAVAIVVVAVLYWIAGLFGAEPEQDQAAINARLKPIEVVATDAAPAPAAAKPAEAPKAAEPAKTESKPEAKPEATPEKVAEKPAAEAKPAEAAASDDGIGKVIYTQTCFACHGTGILESPKKGDAAAWKKRSDALGGIDGLLKSAIVGKGAMPPKGGAANLSDEDLKAAIEYMMK